MKKSTLNDSQLWQEFLDGDSEAYSCIYKNTIGDLYRYGKIFVSNDETIKDCIHDVFVKLYSNRKNLSTTDNILAYLCIALKNNILNKIKSRNEYSLYETNDNENNFQFEIDPENQLIEHEDSQNRAARLKASISRLPQRQQEVIFCRYYKGMSIGEISQVTGLNPQSVSNVIQRALKNIRKYFDDNILISIIILILTRLSLSFF